MLAPESLRDRFRAGVTAIDGGLATELENRGVDISGALWSGRVILESPEALRDVHRAYVDSGSAVIATASYQVSEAGLRAAGYASGVAVELLQLSVDVARDAVGADNALVAASLGPYGAITHDGAEYRGNYGLSVAELARFHAERLPAVEGADLLAFETIPDLIEVRAIIDVLEGRPAWISMSCADERSTCAGQPIEEVAEVVAASDSVVAFGVNCTAPGHVTELIGRIRSVTDLAVVVYPNAGREWDPVAEHWVGEAPEVGLAETDLNSWVASGASLIGGCCGTGPTDIARVTQAVRALRTQHP